MANKASGTRMKPTIESRKIGEWVVMQQTPAGDGPHPVLLLLHGWTGDEGVMWVFTHRLSPRYLMIAPRGIYQTASGGFGWQPEVSREWPAVDNLRPSSDALLQLLNPENFPTADFSDISGIGFSQGAALMFSFALINHNKLKAMAGLSGFLPEDVEHLIKDKPLTGKRIFIAHGRLDNIVPVEKARHAVELLTLAGAQVNYCEEDVGHKLSASCFRSMESFFRLVDESKGNKERPAP